jgi:hypothetical protein
MSEAPTPEAQGPKRAEEDPAALLVGGVRKRSAYWLAALAIVVPAGCGGSENSGSVEERVAGPGPETTTTATKNGATETSSTTLTGEGEEDPCEETLCQGYAYRRRDGGVILCSRLEIASVEVTPDAVQSTTTETTTTETATGETEAEAEPETVTVQRPRCAPGAFEIPVDGLELEALPDLTTSEDGEVTWTDAPITIHGKVVDGTLVADE